jgi:hypothetical protein
MDIVTRLLWGWDARIHAPDQLGKVTRRPPGGALAGAQPAADTRSALRAPRPAALAPLHAYPPAQAPPPHAASRRVGVACA